MQALRRRFVLVALGVLIPVALLVWRALESVEVERRARHATVAERLFDEMERSLSDLLAREEARPVEAYGAGPTVPLAPAPDQPFVIGWFEIDPQGTVRAGPETRPAADALARQSWRPRSLGLLGQAPGKRAEPSPPVVAVDGEKKLKGASSVDEALRSLNKAVEQRAARQKTLADAYVANEEAAPAASGLGDAGNARHDAPAALERENRLVARRAAPIVAPMAGGVVDARRLVLYRTVLHDGGEYRQGLVLDTDHLGAWLREQAIGSGELAEYATVAFGSAEPPPSLTDSGGGFTYDHRFADPFADLTARLVLRPLPSIGGARYVYALSALLVAAMSFGLLALYRMVAVVVGFAERRSNFVAAVSHELKTPLTAIRMYGEMLRDGIVGSEAKRDEYYRHITAESERLSRLINNVLEFSRLEKGTRPAALVVGPIGPVIEEATTLLRPHLEQAGFTVRVTVDADLPPARFERDALLQMLFNLVDNAVKYANGAANREIVLRARRVGDRIVLAVRDHGPGVPAAHLGQIFEPFYRGERELTRQSKGTGLGLALVRGLAEAMGATVLGRNLQDGGFEVEIGLATAAG